MHAHSRYRANPHVTTVALNETDTALLDTSTRKYFSLNEAGTRLWQLLERGADLAELTTALTSEWDVEPDDAEAEVRRLLGELLEEGLAVGE